MQILPRATAVVLQQVLSMWQDKTFMRDSQENIKGATINSFVPPGGLAAVKETWPNWGRGMHAG